MAAPVGPDVNAAPAPVPVEEPRLLPTVSWPTTMVYQQRHLVSIDLALVQRDGTPAQWPLLEEEYTYTCLLDGGGVFTLWAVRDPIVVLHRFGGSLSPAQFVVIPAKKTSGSQSLWLTILNQWGVSVGDYELEVEVLVPYGEMLTVPDLVVNAPVGLSVADDELAEGLDADGAMEFADMLRADDEATVDIPFRDLPGIPGQSLAARTVADPPYLDEDVLEPAEQVGVTRRDLGLDQGPDRETEPYDELESPRRRDIARLSARELREFYNVAGLRRSRTGQLHWDMVRLFSPGSAMGSRTAFTARCSPSDEHGTVFAVVATSADGSGRGPEPRSVQSAKIPPGMYRVTAELLPADRGYVRFHDLPAEPREDPRLWPEIVATVPPRLPHDGGPAHLIIAIETSAPDGPTVRKRLEAATELIEYIRDEARDFICYSIITYGPHRIHIGNRDYPEVETATRVWAVTANDALTALDRVSGQGPEPFGYPWAAQLECVLADLEGALTGQEGRPVLVTVGTRPPFPPRLDPVTEIIPCRRRTDWSVPMSRLGRHAGIKFGAIRDDDLGDRLWRRLGGDAITVGDFDARGFARALGLTSATARPTAPPIALPLFSG